MFVPWVKATRASLSARQGFVQRYNVWFWISYRYEEYTDLAISYLSAEFHIKFSLNSDYKNQLNWTVT
jgi:hypothetical protein